MFELQPASLNLGKIQDVIDDAQQGVGGIPDGVDQVGLVRGQTALRQHIHHANDAIHGGANFVAHGGQEG